MYCSNCGCSFLPTSNFCHDCGKNLEEEKARQYEMHGGLSRPSTEAEYRHQDSQDSVDGIIANLFHRGYPYIDIVRLLDQQGIFMHVRTLKRRLQHLGLSTRNNIDENIVRNAISKEITGPGRLAGYRSVWHALRLRHQIHVPRSVVARLLKELDPQAVEDRRARRLSRRRYNSPGPNFCWHLDGMCLGDYF